ncbi:MAG: hypothetical protein IKX53_08745 [Bacteroidales bacterium]|nr:hypothetical protein [Bacteroidales bacterium]
MKKIALFAIVCCAVVFSSCNRNQQTYTTSTEYMFAVPTNIISAKAIVNTINLYWDGDYVFTGNDVNYTDVKAKAKYISAVGAILARGGDIKVYMEDSDFFVYNLYRKADMALLVSTKFYINDEGKFTSEELYDNVEDE